MALHAIATLMRRHVRSPRLYTYARRAMLLGQYLARVPDEPDFKAFAALKQRGKGLAVDIGANGGQSAVAFAFLLPGFDILSFEPNPALWPELDFVSRILGRRFRYRRLGLGSRPGAMTLYIPFLGTLPVTTRASLDPGEAERHLARLRAEIGQQPEIRETTVEIVTFDSLGLDPDVIKIDVEGFELEVLRGMLDTLRRARPVLLIERSRTIDDCMKIVEGLGYRILYFDDKSGRLAAEPGEGARNWFAVPDDQLALFGL